MRERHDAPIARRWTAQARINLARQSLWNVVGTESLRAPKPSGGTPL